MKLYIPTSSLNADSILSCECVTSARECRKRAFGYSHFEPLEELRQFDYCTLAFSKVPRFNIYDDSRENYRMVVEIEIASPKEYGLSHVGVCEDTDVYATVNPIHLSPANTRLLFYRREEMDYVYHNCSDSAKCKFFDFFKYGFSGVTSSVQGSILANCVDNISIPKSEAKYSENDYNKVKGFIWGYSIGCMLSRSPETAKLLRIQKRIYDIISSTRNDAFIPDSLRSELISLDSEYTKFDPIQRLARSRWNEYLKTVISNQPEFGNEVTADSIDKLLQEIGVETAAKSKFLSEQKLVLRKPLSAYSHVGTIGFEQFNQDLVKHTKSAIFHENTERLEHLSLKDSLCVDRSSYHSVILSTEDKQCGFFNRILSRIIWHNLIPSLEEIRINRKDVAINIVKTLKNIMEDRGSLWQGSEEQAYFDRMRKNISKYEPFELNDISNPVLQSVAAFVLKGEDYESLKSYLENNAIGDYRYALAMWGAMIGYVSIPRSIFDGFNRLSIVTLFNQVESVLGNSNFILPRSEPHQITPEPQLQSGSQIHTPEAVSNESPERFRKKIISFFESTIVKNQRKDKRECLREGLNRALDEFGNDTNPIKFVSLLNDFVEYGWKPSLKPWQTLRDYLAPDYVAKTSRIKSMPEGFKVVNPNTQLPLTFEADVKDHVDKGSNSSPSSIGFIWQGTREFSPRKDKRVSTPIPNNFLRDNVADDTNILIFVSDENIWKYLQNIIPFELRDHVHRDLTWFQDEYAKGMNSKYYAKASRENAATIDAFGRYLTKKRYATRLLIHDIIEFLTKFYVRKGSCHNGLRQ